jgi:hypothetical protein
MDETEFTTSYGRPQFLEQHYSDLFVVEELTFSEPTAPLHTTDVDWLSTNEQDLRLGQSGEDTYTLQDTIRLGFNLNSYLPDRDKDYNEDWERTWWLNGQSL